MKTIHDYQGLAIQLTDERLAHILEHPEMVGMESAIEQMIVHPNQVVESISDSAARLYYRFYIAKDCLLQRRGVYLKMLNIVQIPTERPLGRIG